LLWLHYFGCRSLASAGVLGYQHGKFLQTLEGLKGASWRSSAEQFLNYLQAPSPLAVSSFCVAIRFKMAKKMFSFRASSSLMLVPLLLGGSQAHIPARPVVQERAAYGGGWPLAIPGTTCPSDAPVACAPNSGFVNPNCCPTGQTCIGELNPHCCPTGWCFPSKDP
jgi:hypothetical protein